MFCWCSKPKKHPVLLKKLPYNVILFNAKKSILIHINNIKYCLMFNSDMISTDYPIIDCNYDIDRYEEIYSEWRYVIEHTSFQHAQIILISFIIYKMFNILEKFRVYTYQDEKVFHVNTIICSI